MNNYDVAIIGGGAAGLSAALVLTRARRRVVVIDAGEHRNAPAAHMQGFLSRDGMAPAELLEVGRQEVASYGGHLVRGTVTSIRRCDDAGFAVSVDNNDTLSARRILVTTGLRDEIPDVSGVRERWGRDLLHCPYCHGHEVKDQRLGVLGGTPEAIQHALIIRQWSHDVVYFNHTFTLPPIEREQLLARAIGIMEGTVSRLVIKDDRLVGVELEGGRVVPRDAVFVRPNFVPHGNLLTELGCATHETGWVVADGTGRTSVPGVWAAGNVANPRAQVITAAGEGSAAAIAINNDLVDEDVRLAVHDFASGSPPDSTIAQSSSKENTMSTIPPPTKHQLALMIWIAVFPTLTALNLALGDTLAHLPSVLRTFVLATVAVPIVIYGFMPSLHKLRARILTRATA
ncbi:FAD-dependent oxidoreductase [Aeromicrobium sp.]|uniref:FAD-dependent oxidoreductase n=1 Tax=Aeromicrobium sp. TaxID=1871063 RepID=UPI0030C51747